MTDDSVEAISALLDTLGVFHCESLSASLSMSFSEYQKYIFDGREVKEGVVTYPRQAQDDLALDAHLVYMHEIDHRRWISSTPFGLYIWKLLYGLTDCVTFVLQRLGAEDIRMDRAKPLLRWLYEDGLPQIEAEVAAMGIKIVGTPAIIAELREFSVRIRNYCKLLNLFLNPRRSTMTLGELCDVMNSVTDHLNDVFDEDGTQIYTDLPHDSPAVPDHAWFLTTFELLEGCARLKEHDFLEGELEGRGLAAWKLKKLYPPYDRALERFRNYTRILFPSTDEKVFNHDILMYWALISRLDGSLSCDYSRRLEDILPWFRSARLFLLTNPGHSRFLPSELSGWDWQYDTDDGLLAGKLKPGWRAIEKILMPRSFIKTLGSAEWSLLKKMLGGYARRIWFGYHYYFAPSELPKIPKERLEDELERQTNTAPEVVFLTDRVACFFQQSEAKVQMLALQFWLTTTELSLAILAGKPSKRISQRIDLVKEWEVATRDAGVSSIGSGATDDQSLSAFFRPEHVIGELNRKFGGAAEYFVLSA